MGETGSGKTRLVRYMCDLARQGQKVKNLLILKVRCLFNDGNQQQNLSQVHGGTTQNDIAKFIKKAESEASNNKSAKFENDTVVFFDEANTTDAIDLIKEILCDRRLNGKPVSEDLKFIVACNPYRK